MTVDSNTKTILLPKNCGPYKIIKLPDLLNESVLKPYLLNETQLYELREINGCNPYLPNDNKRPVIPKTGESVKSIIFESSDQGYVVQSAKLIVSSKFNLVYYLISIMYNNESFSKRFITFEDFSDTISSIYKDNEWVSTIPTDLFTISLSEICETIEENGETFYKYSNDKVIEYMDSKVNELICFLSSRSDLSIMSKIKQELYRPIEEGNNEIPSDILHLSILKHSIDLICGSYTPNEIKINLMKSKNYNFDKLETYFKELRSKRKEIELVESNMNSIVESSSKAATTKKAEAKNKPKKKEAKKVAVGKGALDGFFKKAK